MPGLVLFPMKKRKLPKYLGPLLTNQDSIDEGIKCALKAENLCYYSVQTCMSYEFLKENFNITLYETVILPVVVKVLRHYLIH